MNVRDDILAGLQAAESGSVGDATPEELLDVYRAEVLAEAVEAVSAERLTNALFGADVAHSHGIADAVAAITRLLMAGESRG